MTRVERERRRREKHKAQKQRRRENVIKDAEKRLLGAQGTFGEILEEHHYDHKLTDEERARVYADLAKRHPTIPITFR